ncbi:MAG: winged helix-turn-helix transcriptional regulator, partial [Acidimicrobiales bacterium]
TILVIRELLGGSRSFNDIARGVPRMSRTMLSKRLRQLQAFGLVERLDRGYVPTKACEELRPVLLGLGHWAATWIMQDPSEDDCDVDLLMWWAHRRFDVAALPADRRTVLMFHFVDVNERYWTVVEGGTCSICLSDPGFETDAVVKTDGPTMFKVWNGREPIEQAIRSGQLRFEGPTAITRRLPDVLRPDPVTGLLGPGGTTPAPRLVS